MTKPRDVAVRLFARLPAIPAASGCWEWPGRREPNGYGTIRSNAGPKVYVHHVAYRYLFGPIPEGKQVQHDCDNKICCLHLYAGTQQQNMDDMVQRQRHSNQQKTHCPQGHPLSGPNLGTGPRGARMCTACQRAAEARYRAKRRAARS
jgi:hypothetical protein